jgi:hypothetical protein
VRRQSHRAAKREARSSGAEEPRRPPEGNITGIIGYKDQIGGLMAANKIPCFSQYSDFAVAGGLLSYGPKLPELYAVGSLCNAFEGSVCHEDMYEQDITTHREADAPYGLMRRIARRY